MKQPLKEAADKAGVGWFEGGLLCVVLGLNVLRLTIIETPLVENAQGSLMINSENMTLLLSTCVLACALLWLFARVLTGRRRWRRTWLGPAVGLLVVAGVIAAWFASNKRAAVTELTLLASPMIAAMMLAQWLRSASLIRLALVLVISVGVAAMVQCIDQKTESNKSVVAEYEANPTAFLQKMGIEPGTMEHWMFEHRIYSKDIRGFLMTSNSTATFFLMAFFAAVGLCLQALDKKMSQMQLASFFCCLFAAGIVLAGLILTRSKGGIGAFILASALLVLLLGFGKAVWKRRRVFGVLLLLLIVAAAGAIVQYGIGHGRLPGGNSMLVRWQYWVSAVEMIRDHTLTGVGGGNFPEYYTHYKNPAALETIQDPHNWLLSLLSQYGPLGLLAVAAGVLTVFFKGLQNCFAADDDTPAPQRPTGRWWIGLLVFSAAMLSLARPALVDLEFFYQKPDVAAAAYLFLYLIPAMVFVLAFIVLRRAIEPGLPSQTNSRRLSIALMCGLAAVLIHNLVDFAIFEPGNWSLFWLTAAIIIAQIHNSKDEPNGEAIPDAPKRLGLGAGLILLSIAYAAVVLLPPLRAELFFRRAMTDKTQRLKCIEEAIAADTLSPKTAQQAAGLFTKTYQAQSAKDERFLAKAAEYARIAATRNPADFKPYRRLGEINMLLAERAKGEQKQAFLQSAFDAFQQAASCYPGSGKLHFDLASVAEQLGKNDVALCHYQTAVEIEDAYRAQFRIMYPDRKTVISRLGEANYTEAKAKIEALRKNTP